MTDAAGRERIVHVHAGTHKTGTTAIQAFLRLNRERLASAGAARVIDDGLLARSGAPFPANRIAEALAFGAAGAGWGRIRRAVAVAAGSRRPLADRDQAGSGGSGAAHRIAEALALGPASPYWVRLRRAVAATPGGMPLLMSSERIFRYLSAARTEAARRAITDNMRAILGQRIRVILYVRNFGDYFNSLVSERIIATSEARPIPQIVRAMLHLAEIRRVTDHLRAVFGPEAVRLHAFDHAAAAEGGLVRHFVRDVWPDAPADLAWPSGVVRVMPPADLLAVKYRMNALGLDPSLHAALRRQIWSLARQRPAHGGFRILDDALIDVALEEGWRRNAGLEIWGDAPGDALFSGKAKASPYVDLAEIAPHRLVATLVELYQMAALKDMALVKLA